MHQFEYEIIYPDNERPYIKLPANFETKPEHWFMIYEMAKYALNDILIRNNETNTLNEESVRDIGSAGYVLEQISNESGRILSQINNNMKEINDLLSKNNSNEEETN